MAKCHSEAIVKLTKEELKPGILGQLYHEGAKAVHLQNDDRVEQIWMELVVAQKDDFGKPFWQNSIIDFARNHATKQMDVGDMWRFLPGNYGHIARKTVLYPEPGSQIIRTIPEAFWSSGQLEAPPQDILRVTWELAQDVFKSALPAHTSDINYAVVLELLKYPDCLSDLERIFELLADASGGWAQVGQKLDAYKAMTEGPLDQRVVRDLFALGSLIPPPSASTARFKSIIEPF
ncbi:MAG: hypothetical protein ETSY1_26780 [Candidatus Entotheonella factor]|uniref:Uncharacterized protein n=1 Tax=Entotheonella factor TaxID=1429438 RepID=W4LEK1_ENTF1|nr:MAG: hypothetical protein ETSY1_26780 [Candidatus Entotheonella factor]